MELSNSATTLISNIESDMKNMKKIGAEIAIRTDGSEITSVKLNFGGEVQHFSPESVYTFAENIYEAIRDKIVEIIETNLCNLGRTFSWVSKRGNIMILEVCDKGKTMRYNGRIIDIFCLLQEDYGLVMTNA